MTGDEERWDSEYEIIEPGVGRRLEKRTGRPYKLRYRETDYFRQTAPH